jgi:hypothetical protein
MQGRRTHWSFRGLLNVHWLLRPVGSLHRLKRHICLEGSDGFVSSTVAPIATGWSDPDAGQEFHLLKTNTFNTAHTKLDPAQRPKLDPAKRPGPAAGERIKNRKQRLTPRSAPPGSADRSFSGLSTSAAIGRDRADAGDAGLRPACEAINLPILGDEVRGQLVPNDASRSGDDCFQCHEAPLTAR